MYETEYQGRLDSRLQQIRTGDRNDVHSRNACMKKNIKADRTHGYNELELGIVMK